MEALLKDIASRFTVTDSRVSHPGQGFLRVEQEHAVSLLRHLRDAEQFTHLVFLTAVDVIEQGVFRLVYLLHDYAGGRDLGVEVEVPRDEPAMESIHLLWAQAGTYQRELKEMFGIDFPGSPRVDEPFILESWDDIPPMRREFDTRAYSEQRYFPREGRQKIVAKEYMREQLYPDLDETTAGDGAGGNGERKA